MEGRAPEMSQVDIDNARLERRYNRSRARASDGDAGYNAWLKNNASGPTQAEIQSGWGRASKGTTSYINNFETNRDLSIRNTREDVAYRRNKLEHNMAQQKAQQSWNAASIDNINTRTKGLNLKDIGSGVEYSQIEGLMDEIGFSGDQKTAFKSMYDSHNSVKDVAKETSNELKYNAVKSQIDGYNNSFNNMSNEQRVAAHDNVLSLNRERKSLEDKIKGGLKENGTIDSAVSAAKNKMSYAGEQLADSRGKFFNAMGNDAAKLETFSGGLKNLKPLEANKPLQNAEKELIGKGGKFGRVGKVAVGALAMLGVVNMLGGDRGQMENSTLYNPGGPI